MPEHKEFTHLLFYAKNNILVVVTSDGNVKVKINKIEHNFTLKNPQSAKLLKQNYGYFFGELNENDEMTCSEGIIISDDYIYIGNLENGKKQGNGTCIEPGISIYTGEWKDDKRYGKGTCKWSNGYEYVGEWRDNEKYGKGSHKWPDGSEYVGEWKDSKKKGKGAHKWPDGSEYVGEWKNNKKDGKGTNKWPNGSIYTGEWKDDKIHGNGVFNFTDGKVLDVISDRNMTTHLRLNNSTEETLEGINGTTYIAIKQKITNPENSSHILYFLNKEANSRSSKHIIEKRYNTTVSSFDEETNEDLKEINDFIRTRKNCDKKQVVTFFQSHGNKNGKLLYQELFFKCYNKLLELIKNHNEHAGEEEKISRIKINISSCYGSKFFESKEFLDLVCKFCECGIDVRTSAISENQQSSTFFSNGKNLFAWEYEPTNIVEQLFTSNKLQTDYFMEEKKYSRLQNTTLSLDKFDTNLPYLYCTSGIKEYETMSDFFQDHYKKPDSKTKTTSSAILDQSTTTRTL